MQTSHPLSVSAFFTKTSYYRPCSDPFQGDKTTLPPPPLQGDQFLRIASVPAASVVTEAHLLNPPCLLHPDVLPKSRLAPVSADPAETTADHLHAFDHRRSNRANVLGPRLSRPRLPPGDVPYGLKGSNHSLHLTGLASSTSSAIYRRHRRPSGDSSRPLPHILVSSSFDEVWRPYGPLFTATLARTIPHIPGHERYLSVSFSVHPPAYPRQQQLFVFLNHNEPTVYHSRPSCLANSH